MDKRGTRSVHARARINMGKAYEVEYWTKALGVSKEHLAAIISKVGDRVEAVRGEIAQERGAAPAR